MACESAGSRLGEDLFDRVVDRLGVCALRQEADGSKVDRPIHPLPGEGFLREVRSALQPGDALLLGTDLEKNVAEQLLAYADPVGVTAAFNLNLLARINRELGANFDLSSFRHETRWNIAERRIEMHLRSTRRQLVDIPAAGLGVMMEADETIWTESSHKYRLREVVAMAERTGFRCDGQWIDEQWPFAQNLLIAQ